MKIKYLCVLLLAALVYSCDDSTTGIGDGLIPDGDRISADTDSYEFTTQSLLADSVYARTSTAYLGRYTDEQFGEFTADFLTQFTCPDDFEFDKDITEVTDISLNLLYTTFFGDSLNAMRMQVDTLDKVIPEKDLNTFYTSVNPADFYNENAKPLAVKAYSALGPSTLRDSTKNDNGVLTFSYYRQHIKLPKSLGEYMFDKYKENKDYYKNAETFINNVLKGLYVRSTHGDGTLLYIDDMYLSLGVKKVIENSAGVKDSVLYRAYTFVATKEVIQANHFRNSEKLKEIVADPSCTYLKSPAGIFTEATFPVTEIYAEHKNDTLNGANVSFICYNENKGNSPYKMNPPAHVLMVRKKDMFSFFEENKLTDNRTSFTTDYNSSNNSYTFYNIAPLITECINERKKGIEDDPRWEEKNPDWNKVVIIPITEETIGSETNGTKQVVGLSNSLGMESAKLKGGPETKLKMQIFFTRFGQ